MNDLLKVWPEVALRIREARAVALFLDFDGTLAPFVSQPAAARLPWATRHALQRLVYLSKLRIWIVSARREKDLRSKIAVPGLRYLGLYGWENGNVPRFEADETATLVEARKRIADSIRNIPDIRIEDKGITFALHWRGARAASFQQAASAFKSVVSRFDKALRVIPGKDVWEVMPASLLGKGVAVRLHWRACGAALPIYLGDNMADEPAFSSLGSGITVCIGRARPTRAHFQLHGTTDVREFLERLVKEVH